jgi:hypothetical protein
MINNSSFNHCSPYDEYKYVIVAVVSSGSALVSALCCIFVICLIFLLKKHYFFIQRLILYHCLAALFRAAALIIRFHRLKYNDDSKALTVFCAISGFIDQISQWYLMVDFSVITFTLLMTAVFHKNVARLERLYIVLIFIFPLTFNWIPFIEDSYGRSGAWCWIRNLNYDDCSEHKFGSIIQNVLWKVPTYIFLIIMIPTYLMVMGFVARQRCYSKNRASHEQESADTQFKRTLNEEVWPLLFFPLGALILNLLPLANEIYKTIYIDDPSYELSLAGAVLSPLQGGYIALVYTLDCDTIRRLSYSNLVASLRERRDTVREYPAEVGGMSESVTSREAVNYKRTRDNEKLSLLWNQPQPASV